MVVQIEKKFFVADDLGAPRGAVNGLQLLKLLPRKLQPAPLDILVARYPADGRLASLGAALHAIDDPAQNAHILAETGPEKLSIRVSAKPVHVEDARSRGQAALHFEPVAEVVAHVIAAKWQHGHG